MGRPPFALAWVLGAVLVASSPAWAAPGTGIGGPGAAPPAASAASGHGGPALTVLSQTPWVGPGQAMQLHLGVGRADVSTLSLSLTLYQHLTSRSAFAETTAGTAVGNVLSSATVELSSLPADPQGGVDVTVPVESGDAPASGSGPLTARLACAANSCGGVYPLRLQLSSSAGGSRTQLFTYLVYANPPADTQRIRLAWILPVSLPAADLVATGPVPVGDAERVADVLAAANAHATVPLTLAPEPATVSALASSTKPHARNALSTLESLAGAPAHMVLSSSYVPVDGAALAAAGLSSELGEQSRRAAQVLAALRPSTGTWLATGAVDAASVADLTSLGFRHFVVPPSGLSQGFGASLTTSAPFTLAAGRGEGPLTAESDLQLAADLSSATGADAALAGYRTLADLALVYYEQPNLQSPRGVVAMAGPETSAVDPATIDVVLGALGSDPLVSAVTLDDLFTQVPAPLGAARRPAPVSGTANLPVRQIRAVRSRLTALSSAVDAAGLPVTRALDDKLLLSEDDALRPGQQAQAAGAASSALDRQLSTISIRADTIKLTSTAAKVPITVLKQSGYTVTGTLRVSGDKVVFPGGSSQTPGSVCHSVTARTSAGRSTFSCTATIAQATNAVYVDMRARATGDFRLTVTLTSPRGGLVLATNHVTVRSMSSSLVAVGLSVAAVVVLLTWWGRTAWRRRRPRRVAAHARAGRSATKEPVA